MRNLILAHGGTGSDPSMKDGTDRAVEAGYRVLRKDGPLDAVVAACVVLEDDERFNAGTGSNFAFDGLTIQMDAAVMGSRNRYGAVSSIAAVKNPILVARALIELPDNHLTGKGALAFARVLGMEDHDPATAIAKKRWEDAIDAILAGEADKGEFPWKMETLRELWNYERPFDDVFQKHPHAKRPRAAIAGDTIGAVAYDGKTFAAGASTGGTIATLFGRVGDTPTIGAGLFAGEFGAIACTGEGNVLLRARTATKIHEWMGKGDSPQAALRRFTAPLDPSTDFFAIAIGREAYAAEGNREIAWSVREGP